MIKEDDGASWKGKNRSGFRPTQAQIGNQLQTKCDLDAI